MKKELEWKVWKYPGSWSVDEPYYPTAVNVFDHYRFALNLYNLKKKVKKTDMSRKDFNKELEGILRYSFWSKCEYELLLFPWPMTDKDDGHKIDVFEQVYINFERFADYVWNNLSSVKKVEDYRKPVKKTVKKTTKTKEPKNEER